MERKDMNLISHTRFSVQANNLLLVIELLEKLGGSEENISLNLSGNHSGFYRDLVYKNAGLRDSVIFLVQKDREAAVYKSVIKKVNITPFQSHPICT